MQKKVSLNPANLLIFDLDHKNRIDLPDPYIRRETTRLTSFLF
jgi:hypothetical protein